MPKFNLNWMYMLLPYVLSLWWGSDSKGAGNKAVTYSEFQDYVNGYVSKCGWRISQSRLSSNRLP